MCLHLGPQMQKEAWLHGMRFSASLSIFGDPLTLSQIWSSLHGAPDV